MLYFKKKKEAEAQARVGPGSYQKDKAGKLAEELVRKGLITSEEVEKLTVKEIANLLGYIQSKETSHSSAFASNVTRNSNVAMSQG